MSFPVKFYPYFSKRHNSTLTPPANIEALARIFVCELKTGTSIINPTLIIRTTSNPVQWNYCYIENFIRYYYINDWVWANGIWYAYLSCDVLASYKTRIGNSSQYVLRAASESDGNIVDMLFPAKTVGNISIKESTVWSAANYSAGVFVVGIASGATNTAGAAAYYVFTVSGFRQFCNNLMSSITWLGDISDISEDLLKALVNPMQYILSVNWFPLTASDILGSSYTAFSVSSLSYSWYTISVSGCYYMPTGATTATKTFSFNSFGNHPQASARGSYCNMTPFSRYSLQIEPFGIIAIDASKVTNRNLYGRIIIDVISGEGTLLLTGDGNDSSGYENIIIGTYHAQIGVQMPIAQVTQNILGAAGSAISVVTGAISGVAQIAGSVSGTVAGGAVSALTGNVGGAVSSVASGAGNVVSGISNLVGSTANGIISAVQNMAPEVSILGSAGTLSSYLLNTARLTIQYFTIVSDANSHLGRPLCQTKTINTLSGYIRTADADVASTGTEQEKEAIKQFMDNGFFYE